MNTIKSWAKGLKRKIFVLYIASKDSRVPWHVKLFIICVVAYAFSPIDLVPDFIPVLGFLDDLIILPLGIMLALKMIPSEVLEDCESKAEEMMNNSKPKNWVAGVIIIFIWLAFVVWATLEMYKFLK